jgi:hypothetical protein
MRKINSKIIFLVAVFSLSLSLSNRGQVHHSEQITPEFIEIVAKFSEWPNANPNEPFRIGIIGNLTNKNLFENYFSKIKIHDRKVEIKQIDNLSVDDRVDILYIAKTKEEQLSEILKYVKNKPILTVANAVGFSEKGVIINYVGGSNKTIFQINHQATLNTKVKLCYYLFEAAIIINPLKN